MLHTEMTCFQVFAALRCREVSGWFEMHLYAAESRALKAWYGAQWWDLLALGLVACRDLTCSLVHLWMSVFTAVASGSMLQQEVLDLKKREDEGPKDRACLLFIAGFSCPHDASFDDDATALVLNEVPLKGPLL